MFSTPRYLHPAVPGEYLVADHAFYDTFTLPMCTIAYYDVTNWVESIIMRVLSTTASSDLDPLMQTHASCYHLQDLVVIHYVHSTAHHSWSDSNDSPSYVAKIGFGDDCSMICCQYNKGEYKITVLFVQYEGTPP
eukprot:scaffold19276_cov60-Attheya_sp.AAC.1